MESKKVPSSSKLRFAIMCSGNVLPAAHEKCVEELLSIQGLELALLILVADDSDTAWLKSANHFSSEGLLWTLHTRVSRLEALACYRPVDMSKIFAPVPRIHCEVTRHKDSGWCFHAEHANAIREFDLDFILNFAFRTISGDVLQTARNGVWSFHYGDATRFRDGPPGFWEIYYDEPVTGAVLLRLTGQADACMILQEGFIQTNKLSHAANLNAIVWATTYMPTRVSRDILNGRAEYVNASPKMTTAPKRRLPTDIEMAKYFCKTATAWIKRQFSSILFSEDWNIGLVQEPAQAFLDPNFKPQVQWLPKRKPSRYLADPFVLRQGSELKLLAEEFDWRLGRGYIVGADLTHGLSEPDFKKTLDEGLHMSYPYLFEYDGRYYCIPEASQKGNVSLYLFDGNRNQCTLESVLIENFAGVDPTLVQHAGRWWLFCTDLEDETASKLFLWHSETPFGPWEPHKANPVKMDVRSSRPAGRPFNFEGQLYRPAQDCSRTYGGAITINRVVHLTTEAFFEEPVAHIPPIKKSPYKAGIHTIVGLKEIMVIDGKRWLFAPSLIWHRIAHKIRKLAGQNGK